MEFEGLASRPGLPIRLAEVPFPNSPEHVGDKPDEEFRLLARRWHPGGWVCGEDSKGGQINSGRGSDTGCARETGS